MFNQTENIYVNPTEYDLLNDSLKAELISFELEEEKEETSLSKFEKAVLSISDQVDSPQSIFKKLTTITNKRYPKLSASHPWCKELFSCEGAVEFLYALGFKYNTDKTLLICANKPSSELISSALKSFNIYNPYNLKLSPFVNSIMELKNMRCYEQFIWILDNEQVNKLKYGQKDKLIYSQEDFFYTLSKNVKVKVKFGISNMSSDKYTGFKLNIEKLSLKSVSGIFSCAVDELRWFKNGWNVSNLSEGQYTNIFFFEDKLLNHSDLRCLTLRIAVYLY